MVLLCKLIIHDCTSVCYSTPMDRQQPFKIVSDYKPAGDQPQAIASLVEGIQRDERDQTLLGVTGSGKTFTMAHVIEQVQKPT